MIVRCSELVHSRRIYGVEGDIVDKKVESQGM